VSNINTPTEKICEFLIQKFKRWKKPETCSIKNSFEASEIITSLDINANERMKSFDVQALYPSVPLMEALEEFETWAGAQEIEQNEKDLCIRLVKLVLEQRWLMFDDQIYTQMEGLFIGNPLSPILAELFMGKLENKMKKEKWFPRVFLRFVDDVIAIVNEEDDEILSELNKQHPAIQFTEETEVEGKISFLDLWLHREERKITIDIFRKPTDAKMCIPAISHHHIQHKMAAFEAAFFRLCNLNLNKERHEKELKYIQEMARINGYEQWRIKSIYKKHQKLTENKRYTTLKRINERTKKKVRTIRGVDKDKYVCLPFYAPLTNKIQNVFRRHNFNVVFKNNSTLKHLIGGMKQKTPDEESAGIYEIPCEDCDCVYVGQTRRRFKVRELEHEESIRKRQTEKSSVAAHCIENNHKKARGRIVKRIQNPYLLDPWESLLINNNDNLMNTGEPPIYSSLFDYTTTRGQHSFN
jgi:hypothetical protein